MGIVQADVTLDEVCVVACAEAFREDEEILVSPIGIVPSIAARLAKATFAPDILLTDGVASIVAGAPPLGEVGAVESWVPYRTIFDIVWSGRRHVMMGASQIDRFGNQNIACIGEFERPKSQLLGMRGAPGNTINHPTSYWIPSHTPRSFVPRVDVVSGVGNDRAAALAPAQRKFHELRRVVTNKGVFDFKTSDGSMRISSLHPGVSLQDVVAATGFQLAVPAEVPVTRSPTADELVWIRERIDPKGLRKREFKG